MADVVDPDEGQDNPERPEWLPANFDSAEALAQSYKELQGRFTQESQARSALEDNYAELAGSFEELKAALTAQPAQQQNPYDQSSYLAEQLGVEPEYINAAALIAQNAAQLAVQQATQNLQPQQKQQFEAARDIAVELASNALQAKYPDWDEKVDTIRDILEKNPNLVSDEDILSPARLAGRFESVYKQVKYDELMNGSTNDSGQVDFAALQAKMKLNGQTATGASGRPDPVTDEKAAWDAIKNAKPTNYYS